LTTARQLGNEELIGKLYELHETPTELNAANVVAELQFCEQFDRFQDGLLDSAAQHFSEISEHF
jgi:hypothetical protein